MRRAYAFHMMKMSTLTWCCEVTHIPDNDYEITAIRNLSTQEVKPLTHFTVTSDCVTANLRYRLANWDVSQANIVGWDGDGVDNSRPYDLPNLRVKYTTTNLYDFATPIIGLYDITDT